MALHYQLRPAKQDNSDGRPVVFLLHGLFGDLGNLGAQARALSEQYTVCAVDLRNHGRSAWQPGMDYSALAADVLALADQLKLKQFALLGHSMGGKVAMQVAAQAPERISALIVADIAPVDYQPSHQAVFAGLEAVATAGETRRTAAEQLMAEHIQEPGVRQFLLKALGPEGWRFNLAGLKQAYEQILAAPNLPDVYPGPVLFIKGSESAYVQPQHQPTILAAFPNARAKVMQGCGHWLHAEKPALFNRLVMQFLAELSL